MPKIDGNSPSSKTQSYAPSAGAATQGVGKLAGGGLIRDAGGVENPAAEAAADTHVSAPQLPKPANNPDASTYSAAAKRLDSFSIEDAIVLLAKASNEDKESENAATLAKINLGYQDSLKAVDLEKKAAWSTFTARVIDSATDMASNAVQIGFASKAMSADSDGAAQALSMKGSAIGGILKDSGALVGAHFELQAGLDQADADKAKAQAQKENAFADAQRSHAHYAGQLLDMAVQLLQTKAQAEFDAKMKQTDYS